VSARDYTCLQCRRRSTEEQPLEGRDCRHCGRWHCLGCLPDHEGTCDRATAPSGEVQSPHHPVTRSPDSVDRQGFDVERRCTLITGYYLEETHLSRAGHWDLKKIREWAEELWLPLDVIHRGMRYAVDRATSRGDAIYAFGYLEPHIIAAARQYREASAGLGPQRTPREKPEAPR